MNKKNGKAPEQAAAAEAPAAPTLPSPPMGHNIGELSAEQRTALEFRHMRELVSAKAKLDAANSNWRNTRKRIKAEGSVITKIEKMVKAQTDEGRLSLLADIQETKAALDSFAYATQVELFMDAEQKVAPIQKARREAEIAYYNYEDRTGGRWAPGSPEYNAWLEAYDDLMAKRVRENIQPLAAGGHTPLEEAVEESFQQEAVEASIDALEEAVAAVTGEPVEMMPPEPGMPHGVGGPSFTTE